MTACFCMPPDFAHCLHANSVSALFADLVMSQVEKKAGLLRRTSSSKKPLKEKVVLMYDEIFAVSAMAGGKKWWVFSERSKCSSADNGVLSMPI